MADISYDPKIEEINEVKNQLSPREKLEITRVIAKKIFNPKNALYLKHAIYYLLSYVKSQYSVANFPVSLHTSAST